MRAAGRKARSERAVTGQSRGALEDVRVLEFTAGMAGPWIGRFMAYCGAEVIKVESRAYPDVTRLYVHPRAPELGPQEQISPWFTDWNAGKRFIALDLNRPAAVELCKRVVALSDVVVANYSAGVLDKLGLGHEALRAVRPDLIMISSTGFGESGPNRRYVTWGPNIEAISGMASLSGFPHRDCTVTQYAYPDALGALHGLFAVLCALEHREWTGEGQLIDLSQYEVAVAALGVPFMEALANDREPARRGNRAPDAAPQGCYRCAGDDRWCALSVRSDEEWRRLCYAMTCTELAGDRRFATHAARRAHADEADHVVEQWTRTREPHEVMHTLQAIGIACGAVQNVEDQLQRDPQLAAREFFERIEHQKKGEVLATGIPLGLTGTPGRTTGTGAAIGADNAYVFGALLGMSDDEIGELVDAGAIEPPRSDAR
jgi:crotonobetainyl-CoA:carnitine CoA-transferase CaiB-like acyl-CoA transferase